MGLLCGGLQAYPFPGNDRSGAVLTVLTQVESSYAGVEDYSAVFQKQERIEGEPMPEETILLKFQKPLKVLHEMDQRPAFGQRGSLCGRSIRQQSDRSRWRHCRVCDSSLNPVGSIAMKGNRHPITEVGFGYLLDGLRKNIQMAVEHDELEIVRIGEEQFKNRPSIVLETRSIPRGERKYYASRMILHVDKELMLPVGAAFYDDKDRLFERLCLHGRKSQCRAHSQGFFRDNAAYRF